MTKGIDNYQKAEAVKTMITERTGIKSKELQCPREKSEMTPCIARDGETACTDGGLCVGCEMEVDKLYRLELSQKRKKRN